MNLAGVIKHRHARAAAVISAVAVIAFEAGLGISTHAIGIPGVFQLGLDQDPAGVLGGGETVVPKRARDAVVKADADRSVAALASPEAGPQAMAAATPQEAAALQGSTLADLQSAVPQPVARPNISHPNLAHPKMANDHPAMAQPVVAAPMTAHTALSPQAKRAKDQRAMEPARPAAVPQKVSGATKVPLAPSASMAAAGTRQGSAAHLAPATQRKAAATNGPIGWKGPSGPAGRTASGGPSAASGANQPPPRLTGPINLDVSAAVKDVTKAQAKAAREAAKQGRNGRAANPPGAGDDTVADDTGNPGPQPVADTDGKPGEILPWAETEPDPALTGPVKIGVRKSSPNTSSPNTSSSNTSSGQQGARNSPNGAQTRVAANAPAAAARTAPNALPANGAQHLRLPGAAAIAGWVKASAAKSQAKGGRLYHFALWLEPPAAIRTRISSVSYTFNNPLGEPETERSNAPQSGFRVQFEGVGCSDRVTIQVTFQDGSKSRLAVDSCRILADLKKRNPRA